MRWRWQPRRFCFLLTWRHTPISAIVVILASMLSVRAFAARDEQPPLSSVDQGDCIIDTWDISHGLPDNSIAAIEQDTDGYLWLATFGGLVRFDGVRFVVFDQANTPELPDSTIVNFHIDRRGRFWISTNKGLVIRDGTTWRRMGESDGWPGGLVRSFAERDDGSLLITTFDERLLLAGARGLTAMPKPTEGRWLGVANVDAGGRWWISQPGFVGWWDGTGWKNMVERSPELGHVVGRSRDGGVWAVLGEELLKLDSEAITSRARLSERPGGLWGVYEDSRGAVWISTYDDGVLQVSPDGGVRRFTIGRGLGARGVRCVFEDSEHNLWIGTSGGGLTRLQPRRVRVFTRESGIQENVVTSVFPDRDGGVLVATYGRGPHRLDPVTGHASPLTGEIDPTGYAQSILRDRLGRVWLGSDGSGLWTLENHAWRRVAEDMLGSQTVRSIYEDTLGRVWVSAGDRVTVFDKDAPRLLTQGQGIPPLPVRTFAQDASDAIWFSNHDSVFRGDTERFAEVRDLDGRPLVGVTCFRFEPDGTVWMGTLRSGLIRFRAGRCSIVDRKAGMPECAIHGMLVDPDGVWWFATNRGIVRVAGDEVRAAADGGTKTIRFQRFSAADGLLSGEASSSHQPSCGLDNEGRLWFATTRGVAMIDRTRVTLNDVRPPVKIESISFSLPASGPPEALVANGPNEAIEQIVPSRKDEPVVIPAGSRRLQVRYTALSFAHPDRVQFQFSMEGLDSGWQDAGVSRVATYYDPQPGEYTFKVRAANNDGLWNIEGASVRLTVQGFYWQSSWFRGLVAVLVLGLGAFVAGAIGRARLARAGERLTIERQRTELAHLSRVTLLGELSGSLAHELNQPLTAILSNAQAAQRMMASSSFDPDEIREVLGDIVDQDKRAGEVIHRLRRLLKRGEVETAPLSLNELAADSHRLVGRELANRDIEVRTDFDRTLPWTMGDRVQLQQVLLNLIMNSADAMAGVQPDRRVLTIRTSAETDRILVRVTDTGIGISPGSEAKLFEPFYTTKTSGMGLGLSVCRTIVRSHGGEIWAESSQPAGATFVFTLPAEKGPPLDGREQPNRVPGR